MTARADIVARIADRIQFLTGASPDSLAHDKPLLGQAHIDSLDMVEIALWAEEEFEMFAIEPEAEWTVDTIADLVMAARKSSATPA